LLKQGTASAILDKELTSDKVKDAAQVTCILLDLCCCRFPYHAGYWVREFDFFFQIYAPIFSDGHCSLVVVSHTARKKCILNSLPGTHNEVANTLLANLQLYLQTAHNIDISGYVPATPEVKRQENK
jgi:hypothetical protein